MSSWVPEDLDLEGDQTRQVFAVYGAAMYFAQVLEHGLANFLVVSRAGRTLKTHEDVDTFWNELIASTMGRQVREALEEDGISEALVERLNAALRIRNYLAHDYFRERAEQFMTFAGRNQMLAELEELRAELHATDRQLQPVFRSVLAKRGVPEDALETEYKRMLTELRQRAE